MPIERKLERVERPDDPERCQASIGNRQCPYRRVEGLSNCQMHAGPQQARVAEEKEKRNYRLLKWQARVEEFADNDSVKGLREEIGITRMLLEAIVTKCQDEEELLMYSGKIADLVVKIEKLVLSCNRLENAAGMLMDRQQALNLAQRMVEIIAKYITDPQQLDVLAEEIVGAIVGGSPTS